MHICKENYFGAEAADAAAAAAAAAASMAGAEAASTAGAGAATGATTGAGAGAGASSFLPQAARAKAATKVAKTRDLFISLSLKLKKENNFRKLSKIGPTNQRLTRDCLTRQEDSSSFVQLSIIARIKVA
jgi:hypothetical protein